MSDCDGSPRLLTHRPSPLHAGCPPAHKREIAGIFPGQKLEQLLIIPTCQHAVMDLVKTGGRPTFPISAHVSFCWQLSDRVPGREVNVNAGGRRTFCIFAHVGWWKGLAAGALLGRSQARSTTS